MAPTHSSRTMTKTPRNFFFFNSQVCFLFLTQLQAFQALEILNIHSIHPWVLTEYDSFSKALPWGPEGRDGKKKVYKEVI